MSRHRRRSLLKLEHRSEPLLPRRFFVLRMARSGLLTVMVIAVALSIGAFGYHEFERLPWIDAYLNAAIILSGMGPVNSIQTEPGKLFATFYALFSGLAFVSVTAILL